MKSYNCLQLTSINKPRNNVLVTTCYNTTKSLLTLNFTGAFCPKPFYSIWRSSEVRFPNFPNPRSSVNNSSINNRRVSFKELNSSIYTTIIYLKTTSYSTNKALTTSYLNSKSYSMLVFYLKSNMVGLSYRFYKTFLYNLHLTSINPNAHSTSKHLTRFSKARTANPIKYL